jgi:hypothetical protein
MDRRPDVIVEVAAGHCAQLESWLLGHGRIPKSLEESGPIRRYLVKEASDKDVDDMGLVGGVVRKRTRSG